jgi:hypothetical protein
VKPVLDGDADKRQRNWRKEPKNTGARPFIHHEMSLVFDGEIGTELFQLGEEIFVASTDNSYV